MPKGLKGFQLGNKFGKRFVKGQPPTEWSYKKGHKFSPETIIKFRLSRAGKHYSPATEFKPSGVKHVYRSYAHILTVQYVRWRNRVFRRDGYVCQLCAQKGGYLEAHHRRSWIAHPKERYWTKNGVTLCLKCHRKQHKNFV